MHETSDKTKNEQQKLSFSTKFEPLVSWRWVDLESLQKMLYPNGSYISTIKLTDESGVSLVTIYDQDEDRIKTFRTPTISVEQTMVEQGCYPCKNIDVPSIIVTAQLGGFISDMPEPVVVPPDYRVQSIVSSNADELRKAIAEVRVISLDIDDTLMPTASADDQLCWSRDLGMFKDNTADLESLGVKVILNTGRGIGDTKRILTVLASIGCDVDEAICENGSIFYNYKLGVHEINPEINKVAKDVRDKIEAFLIEYFKTDPRMGSLESGKEVGISLNPTIVTVQTINKEKLDIVETDHDIDIYRKWIINLLNSNIELILRDNSQDQIEAFNAIVGQIINSTTAVDINPCRKLPDGRYIGIDKECGTSKYLEENGLQPNDLIVGGDSGGDKGAVRAAGYYFTVANAKLDFQIDPEICGKLIFRSQYNYTNGVIDFLNYFITNRKIISSSIN